MPKLPQDHQIYLYGEGSLLVSLPSANSRAPEVVTSGGGADQDITSLTNLAAVVR